MNESLRKHWDEKYQTTPQEKLGWYESHSQPSLDLIQELGLKKSDVILDIGSGSSSLIDDLIEAGYSNIIASDISQNALALTKQRLGKKGSVVKFIVDDVLNPNSLTKLNGVSLWHDRAVLHFFTEESDKLAYLKTLNAVLKPGGFVIISAFALNGLTQCSGLPVSQYDAKLMSNFLDTQFTLLKHINHIYETTWGQERPFIYTVFQKRSI